MVTFANRHVLEYSGSLDRGGLSQFDFKNHYNVPWLANGRGLVAMPILLPGGFPAKWLQQPGGVEKALKNYERRISRYFNALATGMGIDPYIQYAYGEPSGNSRDGPLPTLRQIVLHFGLKAEEGVETKAAMERDPDVLNNLTAFGRTVMALQPPHILFGFDNSDYFIFRSYGVWGNKSLGDEVPGLDQIILESEDNAKTEISYHDGKIAVAAQNICRLAKVDTIEGLPELIKSLLRDCPDVGSVVRRLERGEDKNPAAVEALKIWILYTAYPVLNHPDVQEPEALRAKVIAALPAPAL